jgi:hypothetical protein
VGKSPLTGRAILAKRAFHLAGQEADARGGRDIRPEHLLLGILRDARDPSGRPRLSRRARRARAYFGLARQGQSPVMLVIEGAGANPDALRQEILAELHAAT